MTSMFQCIGLLFELGGRCLKQDVKRPRIFVYSKEVPEIRELSQGASFCGKGQWGMEVHIHEWLLASPYLTGPQGWLLKDVESFLK